MVYVCFTLDLVSESKFVTCWDALIPGPKGPYHFIGNGMFPLLTWLTLGWKFSIRNTSKSGTMKPQWRLGRVHFIAGTQSLYFVNICSPWLAQGSYSPLGKILFKIPMKIRRWLVGPPGPEFMWILQGGSPKTHLGPSNPRCFEIRFEKTQLGDESQHGKAGWDHEISGRFAIKLLVHSWHHTLDVFFQIDYLEGHPN